MELSIGQNVNLTQEAPDLDHVLVGLRWRTDEPLLRESLEAGVLLTSNGKLVSRQDFVFAHQVLDRAVFAAASSWATIRCSSICTFPLCPKT